MISWTMLAMLALAAESGHAADAGALPTCSNRVINEVVKRTGCTVGDLRCWLRSGGYCNDHVERRVEAERPGEALEATPVASGEVTVGDVAVFAARAHYAYVERVLKDPGGKPVAVDLSEFNFGTCWVDKDALVTERYGAQGRRTAVPLAEVDGGFLRPRRAAR